MAGDQDNFTNEDKKKLFKLLKKIENGENISGKFNKSNYNTQKPLTKKIIYKDEKKEGTLTLLCHSMFYKNNQTFEMFLKEAIKQKLLKDVLNEELIQKLPNGLTITYTALVSCILEENSKAIRAVLETSKKSGILKKILNQKVKVERAGSQETSYTLLDYANKYNCRESAKILKEFEEILNIEVKNDMPVSDNTEAVSTKYEDINKDIEDLETHESINFTWESKDTETDTQLCEDINENGEDPQLVCESSEEPQDASEDTTAREPNTPDIPLLTGPCSGSGKGISADGKSSNQPIVAGVVGAILLAGSAVFCALKIHVIVTVIGVIVGLACIGFSLYNALNPNTKLKEVEDVKQPAFLNPT
ncbi:hypothetical protein HCR17_02440 [Wolbachia pipientis]|nr:hypothetical protein [Wolbachia pipientis]